MTERDLLNPKSSGFRELGLKLEDITDQEAARLIYEHPKIMRRPLLTDGGNLVAGFDPGQYSDLIREKE